MINKHCLMGMIISLTLLSPVFAETQLTSSYSSSKQSIRQTAIILLKEGMLALQDLNGVTIGIYDSDRDVAFAIDHNTKSYYEIDRQFAIQISEQLNSAMTMLNKQMEKAMAGMNEEQKQKFKEMMPTATTETAKPVKANISFIKTGKTNKIAGANCDLAEIQGEKTTTSRICIASPQEIGVSDREMQSVKKLSQLASQLTRLLELTNKQQMKINSASIIAILDQIEGIPLALDAENGVSGRITNIDHKTIANTIFHVPEGFEKKSIMGLMSGIGQQ